jgi:hypothetical protein
VSGFLKQLRATVEGGAKDGEGTKVDFCRGGNGDNKDEFKDSVSSVVSC